MALGPGKYDDHCTNVRVATKADAVILCVVGGDRGNGMTVQVTNHAITNKEIATMLRDVASAIDPLQ